MALSSTHGHLAEFLDGICVEMPSVVKMQTLFHCEFCNVDLKSIGTLRYHVKSKMHIGMRISRLPKWVMHHDLEAVMKEVEDLTAVDVLKVADMTNKLVDELKVCLSRMDR